MVIWKDEHGLHVHDQGAFQQRNPSTAWLAQEADKIYNWPPFQPLGVCTDDFIVSRNDVSFVVPDGQYERAVPCFSFHKWEEAEIPDYERTVREIMAAGNEAPCLLKAGWIGNLDTHTNRKRLFGIGQDNKDIMDITAMSWHNGHPIYMSHADLVRKYSVLIDVEGRGYSGRVKFLLWSQRPLILADRPDKEFYYEHLVPWKHYIPAQRNLSDIEEKVRWCLDNRDAAHAIAKNALEFSKTFLTRDAVYAQWNRVIMRWINVMKP